jgi:hypothetical protein
MLQKHAAIAKCPGADMGQERRELHGFPPFRVDSREIGAIHANRSPADAQGNAKRVSPPPLGVRALPDRTTSRYPAIAKHPCPAKLVR